MTKKGYTQVSESESPLVREIGEDGIQLISDMSANDKKIALVEHF